jgi:O-acetylhomoserine/O-acetylserine sulfhydrylase-like pyridoxal-dependent enzyme
MPPIDQDAPSVPIFQSSTFRFETSERYADTISFRRPGYTYTRGYGNPTLAAFETLMADLEETESAFSFASGMAAIHTVATTCAGAGDRIVASPELYGGTSRCFGTSFRGTASRSRSSTLTITTLLAKRCRARSSSIARRSPTRT